MNWLQHAFSRMTEPSTYAGIGALAMVFGLPKNTIDLTVQVIAGVGGLIAIFAPEKAKP